MSRSPDTELWTCPLCQRKFRIAAGSVWTACPECQKKPLQKPSASPSKAVSPAAKTGEWYVQTKFEPEMRGPLSLSEVQKLFRNSELFDDDLVRKGWDGEVMTFSDFPELVFGSDTNVSAYHVDVYSSPTLINPDWSIVKYLPMVSARRVYGINAFAEWWAEGVDFWGGRCKRFETAAEDIEKELISDMKRAAADLGAHAIVDFKLQLGEFSGHNKFMLYGLAHGTPVVLKGQQVSNNDGANAESYFDGK